MLSRFEIDESVVQLQRSLLSSARVRPRSIRPTDRLVVSLRVLGTVFQYVPPLSRPAFSDDNASEWSTARRMDDHSVTFRKAIHICLPFGSTKTYPANR
jgi:hypothetical protein